MIEKSLYEDYKIDFDENYFRKNDAYYFIFNSNRELFLNENNTVPTSINDFNVNFSLFIGEYKGKDCFIVNADFNEGYDLRDVYDISKDLYLMGSRAVLINDWYISHRYCGRCGSKTEVDEKDMMLKCPKCGQMHYPRIAPAIIVAIRKDDELLMAKHSYHKSHSYSLIAGFVEPGESVEEAVKREVSEEVGIKIKNLEYMKSQTWPFPNSLMLGFKAEYDSGDIKVDGDEIVDARWFKKDEIERYDSDISISDWLISEFIDIV